MVIAKSNLVLKRKKRFTALILFFLTFCIAKLTYAETYAVSADGSAVVRLKPQGTVSSSSLDTSLLNSGWTSTTGTDGTLSVTSYTAGFKSGLGGAEINALYNYGAALNAGDSLEWVQVINTNAPLGGATSPYLDNAAKPTKPFYSYTAENRDANLPANKLNFYDFPKRDPATLTTINPINWNASLYPVVWDGNKGITVQNGISWGWTMKKATVGTDSGVFVNPSPDTAEYSGEGTDFFSWGVAYPDQSWLYFAGGSFDTIPAAPFKLGRLTFHNGTIYRGTGVNSVDFKVAINLDNVPEKNFFLSTPFSINNTPNTDDPIASADFISIGNFGYTFNVLEGETAAVDIYAKLTTGLAGLPTGAVPSGADIFSSTPFDLDPNYILTFTGLEDPSSGGFVTSTVPEPSTFLMFFLGFLILWRMSRYARLKLT